MISNYYYWLLNEYYSMSTHDHLGFITILVIYEDLQVVKEPVRPNIESTSSMEPFSVYTFQQEEIS